LDADGREASFKKRKIETTSKLKILWSNEKNRKSLISIFDPQEVVGEKISFEVLCAH
jgi:hypothetical protein